MSTEKRIPARQAVEQIIVKSDKAISHNALIQDLKDSYNRVTIYRSLDKLVDEGIIHKIIDMDGVSKYAACHSCESEYDHNHNHVHFSCIRCQSVTCLEHVIPSFELPKGYVMDEINFTVSGICPICSK